MKIKMAKSFWIRLNQVEKINSLCERYNSSKQNIIRNNPDLDLYLGEWVKVNVNDYITHFVKPAETLSSIAEKYSKSKQEIINDNALKSEKLFIGQYLKIYK